MKIFLLKLAICCFLCVFFNIFLSNHSVAAPQRSPAISGVLEQSKGEAKIFFESGAYDKAYEMYLRLLREAPDDAEINLGLAFAAERTGHVNQAIIAYERLLQMYPDNPDLYTGLARAYVTLGDETLAQEYLVRAQSLGFKGSEDDEEKLLARLKEENSRYSVHGKMRTGFIYDSNANQGTSSDKMSLGIYDVNVPNAKRIESAGGFVSFNLDLGWQLSEKGPFWLVGDVNGYFKGNFNHDLHNVDAQNMTWGRGAAGLRHLDATTLTDLRIKVEMVDYDTLQHVSAVGPDFIFAWAAQPKLQLITQANLEHRVYSEDFSRNGPYLSAGEYGRLFFGADNHELLLGARYMGGAPKESNYCYDGWEALVKFTFKLPYSFEFAPFISYTEEYYHGPATVLEHKDREDKRLSTGAGITYQINENWAVDLGYQYTDNYSNSNLHEYDQHVVTTGISWGF